MHDYWVALVVSLCGVICYVPMALILYRQHYDNFTISDSRRIGQPKNLVQHIKRIITSPLKRFREARENFYVMRDRAQLLIKIYSGIMTQQKQQEINEFLGLFSKNRISRLVVFRGLRHTQIRSILHGSAHATFRDFLFIIKLILY